MIERLNYCSRRYCIGKQQKKRKSKKVPKMFSLELEHKLANQRDMSRLLLVEGYRMLSSLA